MSNESKKIDKFSEKIQKITAKTSKNRYLQALMGAMVTVMPVTVIGAFATLITIIPFDWWENFLYSSGIGTILSVPIALTANLPAVIIVIAFSYQLAKSFDEDGLTAGLLALVAFLILTPFETSINDWGLLEHTISMQWLGSSGMFSAMLTAAGSTRLYVWFKQKDFVIKLPESVPPVISNAFTGIIPGIAILSLFTAISGIFANTIFGSVHIAIYGILQQPLTSLGGGIGAMIIGAIVMQLLWFFGIHGPMIVFSVVAPIWMPIGLAQFAAFVNGAPLPYIAPGLPFFTTYTSALTLPLVMCMLFRAKSKRYKTIGKIGVVPAMFSIDEPIIFGSPLIMNFKFAIPFIFLPAVTLILAYILTAMEILPRISAMAIPMATPIIMNGFIQGGWRVVAFQIVTTFFRAVSWYYFFKLADEEALKEEEAETQELATT